jgi:hypothetical protein
LYVLGQPPGQAELKFPITAGTHDDENAIAQALALEAAALMGRS